MTDPGDTTVDLAAVSFIDAGGLGRLVGLRNELAAHRVAMNVINAAPRLRKTFTIAGLQVMLQPHASAGAIANSYAAGNGRPAGPGDFTRENAAGPDLPDRHDGFRGSTS
jgi:hypothetical protein